MFSDLHENLTSHFSCKIYTMYNWESYKAIYCSDNAMFSDVLDR